jgi:hypothetical protein
LKAGRGNKGPDLREPWDEGGDCVDAVVGVECVEVELCVDAVDVGFKCEVRVGAGADAGAGAGAGAGVEFPALSVLTAVAQAEKTRAITIYV